LIENSAETVMIKSSLGRIKLKLDSIIYLEVIGHRTVYHTDIGDFTVWESLKEQEALLPKDRFAKCNHYSLINLKHVDGMIDNNVKLKNYIIPVSRSQKKSFDYKLLSFYGKYI
jgi:DNA-binding LytR/AlgR family response regulator